MHNLCVCPHLAASLGIRQVIVSITIFVVSADAVLRAAFGIVIKQIYEQCTSTLVLESMWQVWYLCNYRQYNFIKYFLLVKIFLSLR